jgi:hypothetical protein
LYPCCPGCKTADVRTRQLPSNSEEDPEDEPQLRNTPVNGLDTSNERLILVFPF